MLYGDSGAKLNSSQTTSGSKKALKTKMPLPLGQKDVLHVSPQKSSKNLENR